MSYVLAIDVGTSFTAAALVRPGQGPRPAPEILPLGLHGSAVPSVLYYAEDGRVLVGEAAERRGLDDPRRMVREFKRRIGDSVPLAVGDDWLAPEDVFAAMARWVVDRAEEREGESPSSIIMTHPAAWGQHRTSVVLAALNGAGLADVTVISEPEAAALYYASQTRVDDGSTIAVYDLGGGTFDTAILRKVGTAHFELLGQPNGIETLGGADFDAAVLRYVVGHLGDAVKDLEPDAPATLAALSRLRRECREAKEALSMDSEASIAVSLPGTQQSVRLIRSEFEAMIEAHVRDTVAALERSLAGVRIEPEDLSAVLLIGGSSRIPLVAELISVELDRPIAVDADPKSSICLGAAVAALRSADASALDAGAGLPAVSAGTMAASSTPPSISPAARPHFARPTAAMAALRNGPAAKPGAKPGRHATHPRVRMTAAAAAAATVLTIVTATAAQSPEGNGLLASMFGSQAADVMRDGGATAAAAQPGDAAGSAAGSAPVNGKPASGLDASARAGASRTAINRGQPPAKPGTGNTGAGSGTAVGGAAGAGTAAGGTTPGTTSPNPGGGTSTTAPGTPTPTPTQPGGAASGPTPDPTTPPQPTTPPVTEPTTPPVIVPSTPADPPPTTDPDPTPDPTTPAPQPPTTADPVPSTPVTEPAPAPVPSTSSTPAETTPSPDPALISAV